MRIGARSVILTDAQDQPLAHWSLAAMHRLNPGQRPAVFGPDQEATETLEVSDETLIVNLKQTQDAANRLRPRPGRVRRITTVAIVIGAVAVAALWLPNALKTQTLSMVPLSKRTEIGATLLGHLQRLTGQTCRNPLGVGALATLQDRVLGDDATGQIVVVPGGLEAPVALPGGIIVLPRNMIRDSEDPAIIAGHILSTALTAQANDPLEQVLHSAPLSATLNLLTSGNIPTEALVDYAQHLQTHDSDLPDRATLIDGFLASEVPFAPWAQAIDNTGERFAPLPDQDPTDPILSDGNWVSLSSICQT